jgi:hypothetical protein
MTSQWWRCCGREAYIGVVILAENIKDPAVEVWFDVVEFVDVGVLNPVNHHLAADDDEEGRQDLPGQHP